MSDGLVSRLQPKQPLRLHFGKAPALPGGSSSLPLDGLIRYAPTSDSGPYTLSSRRVSPALTSPVTCLSQGLCPCPCPAASFWLAWSATPDIPPSLAPEIPPCPRLLPPHPPPCPVTSLHPGTILYYSVQVVSCSCVLACLWVMSSPPWPVMAHVERHVANLGYSGSASPLELLPPPPTPTIYRTAAQSAWQVPRPPESRTLLGRPGWSDLEAILWVCGVRKPRPAEGSTLGGVCPHFTGR